jgi:protoporphyrinogen oxidase
MSNDRSGDSPRSDNVQQHVVVIGAGPAGLTAAFEVLRTKTSVTVVEQSDQYGGISRTEIYKGFRFDMGGHRFYSKSSVVEAFWRETLGKEFLERKRLSRIFYRGRFFTYPLKPLETFLKLGPAECVRILCSVIWWKLFPHRQENTFEEWVTNRFGQRLFRTFFRTYTEKVWGISCSELKAEWAAQRIQGLSLRTAVLSMFIRPRKTVRTLIDRFHYPRLGPGMMWAAVAKRILEDGGQVLLNSQVIRLETDGRQYVRSVVVRKEGHEISVSGSHFIASMPITDLVRGMTPAAPAEVLHAADQLRYRDFLTVCLILRRKNIFNDNWIYIHEPSVLVGRIQNYGNWSPEMVPDPNCTSLGLEYFCNKGDEVWCSSDSALIRRATQELEVLGLARTEDVVDGCVFRVEKSYPVYDSDYRQHLTVLRDYVEKFSNLQMAGRNGLHRYNNQDHAMLTGMLAVRNLLCGEHHDVWAVNSDQEYLEEASNVQGNTAPGRQTAGG